MTDTAARGMQGWRQTKGFEYMHNWITLTGDKNEGKKRENLSIVFYLKW